MIGSSLLMWVVSLATPGPSAATVTTLQPQLRFLGPYITVCNYWNIFWTFVAEHFSGEVPTGIEELGAALEMIHTYSLVHDDLPALDDDDLDGPGQHPVQPRLLRHCDAGCDGHARAECAVDPGDIVEHHAVEQIVRRRRRKRCGRRRCRQRLERGPQAQLLAVLLIAAESSQPFNNVAEMIAYGEQMEKVFWYATRKQSQRPEDEGTEVFLSLVDMNFNPRTPAAERPPRASRKTPSP